MNRLRTPAAAVVLGALALVAGCSGASAPAPAPADPLAGEIREFRVVTTPAGAAPLRVWLLEEGDGAHRARVMSTPTGDVPWDWSVQVTRQGATRVVRFQTLFGPGGRDGTVIDPGAVPLSEQGTEGNADPGFFRRLVLLGLAEEVAGSATGDCRDYSAPLEIAVSGITDPAEADRLGYVPTGPGDRAVIRLCGPRRELRRVSTPGYRVPAMGDAGPVPAGLLEFRPVRSRPVTEATIRGTFDLTVAHPAASVSHGDTAAPARP